MNNENTQSGEQKRKDVDLTVELRTKHSPDIIRRAIWITLQDHLPEEFGLKDLYDGPIDSHLINIHTMESLLSYANQK